MSKLLGSSPLGIAFFSSESYGGGAQGPNDGGGNSRFIKPHENFTEKDVQSFAKKDTDRTARLSGVISVGESPAKSSSENSTSPTTSTTTKKLPPDEKAKGENITMDFGLGYQTFGDKRTIFTNNEDMPNTFYVYYDRKTNSLLNNNSRGGEVSLIDYFQSYRKDYYNSDYIDQYSSIPSIIGRLGQMTDKDGEGSAESFKAMSIQLKHADFAYLKKLGVYPSNRLIIARRFAIGAGDDLLMYRNSPLAVIPSWIEDGKSFIDISYGEVWQPVQDVNLAEPASNVAAEWKFDKSSVKNFLETGAGIFSLPGFTEYLQYYLFEKSGLTDEKSLALLPTGNPNIIRQAQTRPTYEENKSFTGLKYSFSIDITTEYEIKYIDGIDPTLVYFDIISNLLRFGTSESQFQFDSRFSEKAKKTLKDFSSGDFETTMKALGSVFGGLLNAAGTLVDTVKNFVRGTLETGGNKSITRTEFLIGAQIKKYRIKFLGIINALTGSPSGIYHITVGNPLRPIFSSGDLIPEQDMKITLGPELGYNNLPTTIKFSCKLKNARACGLQEIYRKFSPAAIRYVSNNAIIQATSVEESYRDIALSSQIRRPRTDNSFDRTPVPSRNTNPQIVPNFTPSGPPPLSPTFPFRNP